MGLKKETKKARKSIIKGMQLEAQARSDYKKEVDRLENLHKERLKLAYDVFNNSMADIGYSLAYIEMRFSKEEYPELWL